MKLFENKNTMIKIILYFSVLVIVCLIGVIGTAWYFKFTPEMPEGIAKLLQPILPQNTNEPAISPYNVKKDIGTIKLIPSLRLVQIKDKNIILYVIEGTFSEKPTYDVGGYLTGNFVITDDPTHTPISVMMTKKTGKIYVGRYAGSFAGDSSWNIENTDVLEQLLEKGKPVQLEMYIPSNEQSTTDKKTDTTFKYILHNDWKFPEGFSVAPMKVGVIINSE